MHFIECNNQGFWGFGVLGFWGTSPKFRKALAKMIDLETGEIVADNLSSQQAAALREWRRDYVKVVKLPASFIRKFSQETSRAVHAWAKAKSHQNFKEFLPHLEKIVNLTRKKADYLGFEQHPYDALLDLYEPGMKTAYLTELFAKLKQSLTQLLKNIKTCPEIPRDCLHGHFDPGKQNQFGHELLKAMGFKSTSSRLDHSNHPFCMGMHPKDTRLTTRIHPDDVMSNIFAVIHEGGHGLYNMGLPVEHFGSPLGEQISVAIDESQSRMWETIVGHSLSFWKHFYPLLQSHFIENLQSVPIDAFYRAINAIKPSNYSH